MDEHLTVGGPLGEHLAKEIPRQARGKHHRFPQVPVEDFEQEMWARVTARLDKFRLWMLEGKTDIIRLELHSAAMRLGSEDERYRRAVKAAHAGYSPDDEEFYSTGMLRHLLPVLIEAEFDAAAAVEKATQATDAAGVRIQVSSPENAAETYMVILIDVVRAFRRLSPYHQRLLTGYYSLSQEDTQQGRWERESKASSQGLTLKAYQRKVDRAVEELESMLGGRNPWLRRRPAKSAAKPA